LRCYRRALLPALAARWFVVVVCAGGLAMVATPVVRGESAEESIVLPEEGMRELPQSIDGKLAEAKRQLEGQEFAEAAVAAVAAFRQAVQQAVGNPGNLDARRRVEGMVPFMNNLARQALDGGDLAVAQHCYKEVRRVAPTVPETVLGLAEVARLGGRPWEAFQQYTDYLKMSERARDHRGDMGMGLVCLQLNKYSLALDYLQRANKSAPNSAEAAMGLARAYMGKHLYKKAQPIAERAVNLDDAAPPDKRHPEYRYYLAQILRGAGQLDRAVAIARQFVDSVRSNLRDSPGDGELIDQLDTALAVRLQLLQEQMRTDEGRRNPQVRLEMARTIEDQGLIRQIRSQLSALNLLQGLLEEQPENVDVLLAIARLCRLVGKKDDAIAAYQRILEVSPGNEMAKKTLREMGAPLQAPKPKAPSTQATTAPTATAPATTAPATTTSASK
jgi:tetratricopeptide (TPR) repeat protein